MLSHQLWCLGHHRRRVQPVPPLLCSVGWGRGLGQASTGGSPQPSRLLVLRLLVLLGQSGGCQVPRAEPPGTWEQGQDRDGERGGGGGRAAGAALEGCCQRPQDGTLGVGTALQNKGSAQSPACSSCPAPHPAAPSCSPIARPHCTAPLHSPIPQPHPGTVRCWRPNTTIIRRDKPQTGSMAMSAWCTRSWVALPVAAPVPGRQLTAAFPPAPAPEPQRRRAPACCVHQHRLSGRAGR